jgi:predicted Rossmann-fold nucleotide-binding protein
MKLTIDVMGSAGGAASDENWARLGRAIAERDCTLITGACPGLPYAAVEGARAAGGLAVGISPALSLVEHVQKYQSPTEGFDVLIYTGSGLMGREVDNIRSSDMVGSPAAARGHWASSRSPTTKAGSSGC